MVNYDMDEMQGDQLVASHRSSGPTALDAPGKINGRALVVRHSQIHWFRVVDERQGQVFKYAYDESFGE